MNFLTKKRKKMMKIKFHHLKFFIFSHGGQNEVVPQ